MLHEHKHIDLIIIGAAAIPEVLKFIRTIRSNEQTEDAGIMVAQEALGKEESVELLNAGADICFNRTISETLFSARVRSLLRQHLSAGDESTLHEISLTSGKMVIDTLWRKVIFAGKLLELSRIEFDILLELVENFGWAISRSRLTPPLERKGHPIDDVGLNQAILLLTKKLNKEGCRIVEDKTGGLRYLEN